MLNEIMDAVTVCLQLLLPDVPIHDNDGKQEWVGPCLLTGISETTQKQVIGQRYFYSISLQIRYLPGNVEAVGRELNRVADILATGMEFLPFEEGLLQGRNIKSNREGGILTFFVDYHFYHIRRKEAGEKMGYLNTDIRKGE